MGSDRLEGIRNMVIAGSLSFKKLLPQKPQNSPGTQNVVFNLAQDVPLYDYFQAQKTWDAFLEAGIEPGELVVKGLHTGHNYPIVKKSIKTAAFKETNLISDYQSSPSLLIGYTKTKPQVQDSLPSETVKNTQNSFEQAVETYLDGIEKMDEINLYIITPSSLLEEGKNQVKALKAGS